jgi:hypothetical protein
MGTSSELPPPRNADLLAGGGQLHLVAEAVAELIGADLA